MTKPIARPMHCFRILPGAVYIAKVAAAKRRLPLGQWLEQAIADRAKRDVLDELSRETAEYERLRKSGCAT